MPVVPADDSPYYNFLDSWFSPFKIKFSGVNFFY